MGKIPKVPEDQFKAVVKALLNTPPMPMATISPKRERKDNAKRTAKKRG